MANYTPDVSQDYTDSFDEEVHTEYIVKEEEVERELNLDIIPHPGDHNFAQQPGKLLSLRADGGLKVSLVWTGCVRLRENILLKVA